MQANNLIHMANRIGEFFEAMPEREEALHGVAEHIQKFWDPRMRRQLAQALQDPQTAQAFRPLVYEALLPLAAAFAAAGTACVASQDAEKAVNPRG
ncbi:formate dehydrogenase subunit delta [Comamonas aquatilis]|uniref:formate dehydrogenase subunit delta n=1 Tax=Comamonas aquatilis TaxID=1778406 RepID=UPI0039EEF713